MNNEELWKAVLGEMELSLSKAQFITWFKNTTIVSNQNGRVVIGVPNGFAKEWLENKFNLHILQSLRRLQNNIQEISCVIRNVDAENGSETEGRQEMVHKESGDVLHQGREQSVMSAPISRPQESMSQNNTAPAHTQSPLHFSGQKPVTVQPPQTMHIRSHTSQDNSLNPRYTFDNFIVGENNELARAACYAVSQNLGRLYNPLFIYGGVGLGKTHLLQSIGNEIIHKYPDKKIKYTTSERFTNELIESIRNQKVDAFKDEYQKVDLLIIDDVQFLSGREKTQNEFFHIFNTLYQINKQIVISSDRPPQAIPTLEDRLRSRFQGGMIADISRPDLETRMAILRIKLAERHFYLDDDAVRFIAEHIVNNVRELEGALNRVVASCEFHKTTPTLPYIRKILGDILTDKKKAVNAENIIQTIVEFYGVAEEDLIRKGRKQEIAHPRQVAMYLMRSELKTSLAAVGKYFGGRDHTTVLHACEKIQKDLDENLRLKEEINSLKDKLYKG